MDKKTKILLSLSLIIAFIVGYGIGSYMMFQMVSDVALRALDQMDIVSNITNSEIITKLQQHINLLP